MRWGERFRRGRAVGVLVFAGFALLATPSAVADPPVVSGVPSDMAVEATSGAGADVTWPSPTAFDGDGNPTSPVICAPPSGSTFPLGVTTVTCGAEDLVTHDLSPPQTFTVTVQDTTPPSVSVPGDQTAEATGSSGAAVTFSVTASDAVDSSPTITCDHTSGATYPIGTTTVSCYAKDSSGNTSGNASFNIKVQDTTPPTVTPPAAPPPVEATGPSGAAVSFGAASASDLVDGSVSASCSPTSGSTFPVGTTTVTCSATDAHGNKGSNSFGVTVRDTTSPVVTVPGPITAEATSSSGAVVTFSASASDAVAGSPTPTCSPSSGSSFPLGLTTVNCTATDGSNTGSASFSVTVHDTTKPTVTVPTPITAEATGPSGAAVTFSASASDSVSGSLTPSCSPSSGSTFGVGTTTVNCNATDGSGNTGTASFSVKVQDTTAPVITVPSPITAEATGPSGAVVTFSASASDLVDGSPSTSCSPTSGSTFAITATTVNCSATDSHGNTGSASFTVTVQDTTVPTFTGVPATIVVEADGTNGSRVTFTNPTASDVVDGGVLVSCSPTSNSLFGVGDTTVSCSATDAHTNTGTASFIVTVRDTTKPVLNAPAPASFSSGGASQLSKSDPKVAAWLASASASDLVDGHVPVTNDAPAELPLGVTLVTFTAVDLHENIATAQSRLTVVTGAAPPANLDTTPPGEVRSLKVRAGDRFIDLTWALPPDADFDHVTVTRSTGTDSTSQSVYSGKGKHLRDTGLKNGTGYRYVFVTWDAARNRSVGAAARATPKQAVLYAPTDGAVVTKPPVLKWARIGGASYYNLQLYRLGAAPQFGIAQPGQKVLSVWPTKAQYALSKKWKSGGRVRRLTAGRYVWYVWPGLGPKTANRYGTLLGQSTFVVKASH